MSNNRKWRKSSRSNSQSACVELSVTSTCAEIRDTKQRDGGIVSINGAAWTMFLADLKAGRLVR